MHIYYTPLLEKAQFVRTWYLVSPVRPCPNTSDTGSPRLSGNVHESSPGTRDSYTRVCIKYILLHCVGILCSCPVVSPHQVSQIRFVEFCFPITDFWMSATRRTDFHRSDFRLMMYILCVLKNLLDTLQTIKHVSYCKTIITTLILYIIV